MRQVDEHPAAVHLGDELPAELSLRKTRLQTIRDAKKRLEARKAQEAREEDERKARKAAEEAMWAWYLEWSTIARHAISDRNLLRALGFLCRRLGLFEMPRGLLPRPPGEIGSTVDAVDGLGSCEVMANRAYAA